jgi:ornithine cyclodeaminase
MKIYTREQIEASIHAHAILEALEQGLMLYSAKQVETAPVGFLHFKEPPGELHIKAGYIPGDDFYVIKIASGFYDNPKLGLRSSGGLMLLFSQKTGELQAILHDEGRLTDLRTGFAGAICAKYLAPRSITCIGIIGTGIQAKEQLLALEYVTSCRDVFVWGRDASKADIFSKDPSLASFRIRCAKSIEELTQHCNLIVTVTASTRPLLFGHQLRPGTHVTAVGADGLGKQELDVSALEVADLLVADSLSQCLQYGDLSRAKDLKSKQLVELGTLIKTPLSRQDHWITIADLTGVAIEDLQIAKAVFSQLQQSCR